VKRGVFYKIKEVERERGGVHKYAAQVNVLIDVEIVKKNRFRIKTK